MGDVSDITHAAILSRDLSVEPAGATSEGAGEEAVCRIALSFSSEEPARQVVMLPGESKPRSVWEVLDHSDDAVDLSYLRSTGAFLFAHKSDCQIGTLEDVAITPDRKGRAIARFGRGEMAQEKFQDVKDGILRGASVTYNWVNARKEGTREGLDVYRVTKWQPLEVSLVPVPRDITVGVGRSQTLSDGARHQVFTTMADNATSTGAVDTAAVTIQVNAAREDASQKALIAERSRVKSINTVAEGLVSRGHSAVGEIAKKAIVDGMPVEDFQRSALEAIGAKPTGHTGGDTLESRKDKQSYSIVRAIRSAMSGKAVDGFEGEVSQTLARDLRQEPKGFFVPAEVFQRDQTAGSASGGGALVATDLLANELISKLDIQPVVDRAGARVLRGLRGDIAIPKHTGGFTAYWLPETGTVTVSTASFGTVGMTPHRLVALGAITTQLMAQNSADVEGITRQDLMLRIALAKDRAAFQGAGANGEPKGLYSLDTTSSGVGTITFSGAADWADMVEYETQLANDEALAGNPVFITRTNVRGKWKSAIKHATAGNGWLWEANNTVNGYPALVSNNLPANAACFGNWADFLRGEWAGMDVIVDPYSRKKEGIIEIQVTILADQAFRHAESFVVNADSAAQ